MKFYIKPLGALVVLAIQSSSAEAITPEVKIAASPLYMCDGSQASAALPTLDGASGGQGSIAVSTSMLASEGGFIYRSSFYSSKWGGGLKKYAVTLDINGLPQVAASASWDASDSLTGLNGKPPNVVADSRRIFTSKILPGGALATIELKWANLSVEQQSVLNTSSSNGVSDGLGEKRLNYLRGARDLEQGKPGGIFRARDRVLGDIVNSNSVFVASPAPNGLGSGYQKFYEDYKNRTKAVYVGANDGILHAFDADSGMELFAYIPNVLFSNLNQLTRADYAHRPYVDGTVVVAEARAGGSWKTVLASTMGGGAQGVFAMDVTNPSDFSAGVGALWEFTDSDDADIGNQMGTPVIAKFRTGAVGGKAEYKYFVMISSGLNNYKEDGPGRYDPAAPGALFMLSSDKAPSEKWQLNVNYFKFNTPIKDAAKQNGLSAPALVVDGNGAVRFAYAGDLQGSLWRFDFSGSAPWSNALASDTPRFIATDSYGNLQPITTQPKIVFAPGGGYVVLFGTGKLIEESDMSAANFRTQTFYAVYDTTQNQDSVSSRTQLAPRLLSKDKEGGLKISGDDFEYGSVEGKKKGWYFDFLDSEKTGERSVTNAVSAFGKLFFNTVLPGLAGCDKGGGRSYSLDILTGLSPRDEITGYLSPIGMLTAPVIFQIGADVSGRNPTGKSKATKKYVVFNFGTGGAKGASSQSKVGSGDVGSVDLPAKRFSWREIVNWQELRDAANKK